MRCFDACSADPARYAHCCGATALPPLRPPLSLARNAPLAQGGKSCGILNNLYYRQKYANFLQVVQIGFDFYGNDVGYFRMRRFTSRCRACRSNVRRNRSRRFASIRCIGLAAGPSDKRRFGAIARHPNAIGCFAGCANAIANRCFGCRRSAIFRSFRCRRR